MAENSKIEWTDHTFNPWRGCTHATLADGSAHPGCEHCYAEAMSKRNPKALGVWGDDGKRVVGAPSYWQQPLKWNAAAGAEGVRRRVFCASLADVFEDCGGMMYSHTGEPLMLRMESYRLKVFELIDSTPQLDWLLLTKRPGNVRRMWPIEPSGKSAPIFPGCPGPLGEPQPYLTQRFRPNVWLLTSVSNQQTAEALVPELLNCRGLVPVLGLSVEPLLGPINLRTGIYQMPESGNLHGTTLEGIDWVIVGGESGHSARPMQREWVRSIRDQCHARGVAYFFKQWGGVNKHETGRLLDGVEYSEFPESVA